MADWTTAIFDNAGRESATFDLKGDSIVTPCPTGGPFGFELTDGPGASEDVPPLALDFTGWEGAAVSLLVPQWGASGTFNWPPCALHGTGTPPFYYIIGYADGVEIFSGSYDRTTGYVGTFSATLTLPAPFTIPALHVDVGGDYFGLRFSIIHTVTRWVPATTPPGPPDDGGVPEFTPAPPPLALCGGTTSPPVIGSTKSGVLRGA